MNFIDNRKLLIPTTTGIIGVILIMLITSKYGPGITHDSAAYLFAAESVMSGKGFVYFGYDTPFVQWPPLFTLLIAFLGSLGMNLAQAGRYLNVAAYGLIIFFSSLWLCRNVKSYMVLGLSSLAILFSIPLLTVARYIWSEPLFILLVLLFLITIEKYMVEGKRKYLLISAVFASMACITRYTGVVAVFTGGLFLLIENQKLKRKILDILLFGFISCLPLSLWLLRNYLVFSTLTGTRAPSQVSLFHNIGLAAGTVISWILPFRKFPVGLSTVVAALILIVLAAGAFLKVVRCFVQGKAIPQQVYKTIISPSVMFAFAALYTVYLVATASLIVFDPIGDRLLAPVFIPLVLVLFYGIDRFFKWTGKITVGKYIRYAGIILICVWLLNPMRSIYHTAKYSMEHGAGGYSSDSWSRSVVMEYIDEIPAGYNIYSNYPDAIYSLKGRHALYPPKNSTSVYEYAFESFAKAVKGSKFTYIIWFNNNDRSWFYNMEKLGQYFEIERVAEFEDGVVFSIKADDLMGRKG